MDQAAAASEAHTQPTNGWRRARRLTLAAAALAWLAGCAGPTRTAKGSDTTPTAETTAPATTTSAPTTPASGAPGSSDAGDAVPPAVTVASAATAAPTAPAPTTADLPTPKSDALRPNRADDPYAPLDRCPPEMALVTPRVCIDRWEASLVEVLSDGRTRPWSPYKSPARKRVRAVSRVGVVPQGYINGVQAAGACREAGKRLCEAREWERACRGPDDTTFPYGNVRRDNACNDDGRKAHPVFTAAGRLGWSMDRMWREGMDHPIINQLADTVEKTGSHPACTNALGVFDMVGNLHEWIADPDGTFRGGYFMDTKINGDGCEYATTAHSMKYHDYSIGFRCCMDASQD